MFNAPCRHLIGEKNVGGIVAGTLCVIYAYFLSFHMNVS